MSSVAFLCGIPQGAAGPESGVEIPNLMTSAARLLSVLPAINAPAPKSTAQVGANLVFILAPPWRSVWVRAFRGASTIKTRHAPVKRSEPAPRSAAAARLVRQAGGQVKCLQDLARLGLAAKGALEDSG